MKKQALLATVSLALVALASCGGSSASEEVSGSEAGSVSDSTSESVEPTLLEQWEAIENWQGGIDRDAFFVRTATIATQSFNSTSRKVVSEDLSGEVGTMFRMEEDWGYLNQRYTQDCSIYNNDRRVCSIVEETDHTNDEGVVTTDVLNQTAVAYFETVDTTTTYYNVVDDGSETYALRNNYYTSAAVQTGATFKSYGGFTLSTTSGIGQRLTLAYYNSPTGANGGEDPEVKYYTNTTDEAVEYIYWAFFDYSADPRYAGHSSSIKIVARFNGEALVGVDLEQGYYYYGSSVFISTQYLEYGYADNGDYNEAVPDHTLYKLYGTLELDVEDGNANFVTYWNALAGSATGATGALEYGLPTSSLVENYIYNDFQYARTYEMVEEITTTVYSDGYVVSDYAMQEINVEQGGVDSFTGTSQISSDETNIYQIVKDYDNNEYKVTTPISETDTWAAASDISEWDTIRWMSALLNSSLEKAYAAYLDEEDGTVELYVQAVQQQGNGVLGYVYEADIVFEIVADDESNPIGLNVLASVSATEGIYNWESLYIDQTFSQYGYEEAISTSDANYTPLDPDDFVELPPVTTTAA